MLRVSPGFSIGSAESRGPFPRTSLRQAPRSACPPSGEPLDSSIAPPQRLRYPRSMPKAQATTKVNAVLRMSSAIEDAAYALDSALDARVVASCTDDDLNTPRLKAAAPCGTFSPQAVVSWTMTKAAPAYLT